MGNSHSSTKLELRRKTVAEDTMLDLKVMFLFFFCVLVFFTLPGIVKNSKKFFPSVYLLHNLDESSSIQNFHANLIP